MSSTIVTLLPSDLKIISDKTIFLRLLSTAVSDVYGNEILGIPVSSALMPTNNR